MNTLQLVFFIVASFSFTTWVSSEGSVGREYLPVAVPVVQRKTSQYPSYYQPLYNQYYPQYTNPYYHPYNNGYVGGYHQHALGQQIITGTSLGSNSLGLGHYYPQLNVDVVTPLKPRVDVIETVYDANGGYVYGKKK